MSHDFPVLLVDDEPHILFSEKVILESDGIKNIITLEDSRKVMPLLAEQEVSAVVTDILMPHISGDRLLCEITRDYPQIPVIVITARNEPEAVVECMKNGAFDYLVKPVEKNRFLTTVKKALEVRFLRNEVSLLTRHFLAGTIDNPSAFESIITRNPKMKAIFNYMEAVANSPQPVLITGETGVGKELIAKAIHTLSGKQGPFTAVNVAGLDDTMFSDTLFGHKRGAYTGADNERDGLISQASGGTLFLDEIGDLQESSQVKLLRLLQDHRYYPLGSDIPKKSGARIIVATNSELLKCISEKRFRKDLYYRLRTHNINIPPLRERLEDIPLLLHHFLEDGARAMNRRKPTPPPELITLLSTYGFPGNVRELQAMVNDAVARHKSGILSMESFKEAVGLKQASHQVGVTTQENSLLLNLDVTQRFPSLKETEEFLIKEALKIAGSNQGIAASLLGITRQALNKRLNRTAKQN